MPRKGRFLELLVERLEAFLGVEGVMVKSPEIFFKDGKIIGEIDITLRGNFGSSRIFIGVECRDRPASGPQGIDWIRTIYGKQSHLKVDKMMAVSSTGFTDDAVELATQWKIDLLTLNQDELGEGDLKDWLKVSTIPIIIPQASYSGKPVVSTRNEYIRNGIKGKPLSAVCIQHPQTKKSLLFDKFLDPMAEVKDQEFYSLNVDTWDTEIILDGPLTGVALGRTFLIDRIVVPLRFTREVIPIKMIMSLYKRLNDREKIALSGMAEVKLGGEEFKLFAMETLQGEKKTIEIIFSTLDGEPYVPKISNFTVKNSETGEVHEVVPFLRPRTQGPGLIKQ